MKIYLSAILILIFNFNIKAQITGLSASKTSSYCVETVPAGKAEIEPYIEGKFSSHYFGQNGKAILSDSISRSAFTALRITYGITDKLEAGIFSDLGASQIGFGARYQLYNYEKNALACISGINLPFSSKKFINSSFNPEMAPEGGFGFVSTINISSSTSIDITAQYLNGLQEGNNKNNSFFLNADFGKLMYNNSILIVAAAGYSNINKEFYNSQNVSIFPGFCIEKAKNFILTCVFPVTLWGINSESSMGMSLAMTITIE